MAQPPSLRDKVLTDDILDVLGADRRLSDLALRVQVIGGVAHVEGSVCSNQQRDVVRQAIGRVRGVLAVWDRLTVSEEGTFLSLDLGCGSRKQDSRAIGIDRHPYPGVSVVADLERSLPLADSTVDRIFAVHILEHVQNLLGLMNEVHRVLKPRGVLHVIVPNMSCTNAVADPTHVRLFHLQTFKYFCRPNLGVRLFKPLSASATATDIFIDLQPVKERGACVSPEDLSRFFE